MSERQRDIETPYPTTSTFNAPGGPRNRDFEPAWARALTNNQLTNRCKVKKRGDTTIRKQTTSRIGDVPYLSRKDMVNQCKYEIPLESETWDYYSSLVDEIKSFAASDNGLGDPEYETSLDALELDRDAFNRASDEQREAWLNQALYELDLVKERRNYLDLKGVCIDPQIVPDPTYDGVGDCPLFTRPNAAGCCVPAPKTKFKAAVHAIVGTVELRKFMNIISEQELATELNKIPDGNMTIQQKQAIVEDHRAANKELDEYLTSTPMSDDDKRLLANLGPALQRQFAIIFERTFDQFSKSIPTTKTLVVESQNQLNMATSSKTLTMSEQNWFQWTLEKLSTFGGYLWKSTTYLRKWGVQWIKMIVTNPRTARIMIFIAHQLKRDFCDYFSVAVGSAVYQRRTFQEETFSSAEQIYKFAKQMVPTSLSAYMNSSQAGDAWDSFKGSIVSGFGAVLGAVPILGRSVPVVGALMDVTLDIAKHTSKIAFEATLYKRDVSESFRSVIEFLDFRGCWVSGTLELSYFDTVEENTSAAIKNVPVSTHRRASVRSRLRLASRRNRRSRLISKSRSRRW